MQVPHSNAKSRLGPESLSEIVVAWTLLQWLVMRTRVLDALLLDMRYVRRSIVHQPFVTAVIVLTLSIGIGVNVAVFSIANALLIRPMPVPHPQQLVRLYAAPEGGDYDVFSYPNYLDFRDEVSGFAGLAAHQDVPASIEINGNADNLIGEIVTGNYFTVMGTAAQLGRTLLPSDDERMEQGPVAVISFRLWQRRYASDPNITGSKITINGHVFSIAGVMPEGFLGAHSAFQTEFWVPMSTHELVRPRGLDIKTRGWGWLHATGRLRPGVSLRQAGAEVDHVAGQLRRQYPAQNKGLYFRIVPATALPENLSDQLRKAVSFLGVVSAIVLLVACANVAGILLSRFFGRSQETAVRRSLGANRLRIMMQYLTESTILSLLGGAAGFGMSLWVQDGLRLLAPPNWPAISSEFSPDWRTLFFALAVSLITGLLAAAAPLIRIRGLDLNTVLREESFSGRKHSRLFGFFVAAQVALCTILLIVAGLLLRSLNKSFSFDPGFNTRNLIVATIDLNRQGYDKDRAREFFRQLSSNLSALPGVSSVSYSVVTPLGNGDEAQDYAIPGHTPPNDASGFAISNNIVGPDYFKTMEIPIIAGRPFDSRESNEEGKPAVIINETMAHLFWGNESPIGKSITLVGDKPYEIIGVARDIKYYSLAEKPIPYVYLPFGQTYLYPVTIDVRTSLNAASLLTTIKAKVTELKPDVAMFDLMTFEEVRSQQLFPVRALALLSAIFGSLALLLTAVGIYGVLTYTVRRRTHEIGVRMALGARRQDIVAMVLRYAVVLAGLGLACGSLVAAGATRLLSSLLFGVGSVDPVTYVAAFALLSIIALTAGFFPARRASKVDPAVSLRYE